MHYFDHAATTPVAPDVLESMLPFFSEKFGNPSALYKLGQEANALISSKRKIIASYLGVHYDEVFFTGGATESIHTALKGIAHAKQHQGKHILLSSIEHSATLIAGEQLQAEGFEVEHIPTTPDGIITPEAVQACLRPDTILVSIMYVNNEIGTIQPLSAIGALLKTHQAAFHTDASQAYPYLSCNMQALQVDALTIAAHKFGGPKGIALLAITKDTPLTPLIGGHQEFGLRGGTQNTPAIAGMAKAMEIVESTRTERNAAIRVLRDTCWEAIQRYIPNVSLHGSMEHRICNNLNIAFHGTNGQDLVIRLDLDDIAVAQGSACTTNIQDISHVLKAIGIPDEQAVSTLRITFGHTNTLEEIDMLVARLAYHVSTIRHMNITY